MQKLLAGGALEENNPPALTGARALTVHFPNPCLHRLTAAYNHQLTW